VKYRKSDKTIDKWSVVYERENTLGTKLSRVHSLDYDNAVC